MQLEEKKGATRWQNIYSNEKENEDVFCGLIRITTSFEVKFN
jgi:hypothetical protein